MKDQILANKKFIFIKEMNDIPYKGMPTEILVETTKKYVEAIAAETGASASEIYELL